MKEKWLTFHWSILLNKCCVLWRVKDEKLRKLCKRFSYIKEMNNVTQPNIFKANTQVDHTKILWKKMQCTWYTKTQNTQKKAWAKCKILRHFELWRWKLESQYGFEVKSSKNNEIWVFFKIITNLVFKLVN
jgi:hypothetical protein